MDGNGWTREGAGNRMRRKEKEIIDRAEIEAVIAESTVCRLAMADDDGPYLVPLCFGYKENTLYFHSAGAGKKLDILKKGNRVCFEFDIGQEIIRKGENGCEWSMKYRSVIGFGRASFVDGTDAKRKALDIIMGQYGDGPFEYSAAKIEKTTIVKVDIKQMTGKRSG